MCTVVASETGNGLGLLSVLGTRGVTDAGRGDGDWTGWQLARISLTMNAPMGLRETKVTFSWRISASSLVSSSPEPHREGKWENRASAKPSSSVRCIPGPELPGDHSVSRWKWAEASIEKSTTITGGCLPSCHVSR